ERLPLSVDPELAEMPLHGLPRPARRDAHLLVVIAGGAARGERVAEPEAVLGRKGVRNVRERGRALVRGDDEIRIRIVERDDTRRRDDALADDVVGDVEEPANERAIAFDD